MDRVRIGFIGAGRIAIRRVETIGGDTNFLPVIGSSELPWLHLADKGT